MLDSALVRAARQADLAAYLLSIGVPLVRSGNRYKHVVHDSLVIKGNMYYWNSKADKGNSLDYLMRHMGMDFQSAASALVGFVPADVPKPPTETAQKGNADNFRRAFAYLHKTRGISYGLLQTFVDKKLLAQEAGTNNAVFYVRDEKGETVGAEFEGTLSDRRFKGVQAGSKYGYGFNVMLRGDAIFYILFFESAVDLLSFAEIKRRMGKELNGIMLVSMCGLKPNVVKHMTATFGGHPMLCPDNDDAADEFLAQMPDVYMPDGKIAPVRVHRPMKLCKDWNDQLLNAT